MPISNGGDVQQMRLLGNRMVEGAAVVQGLVKRVTAKLANVEWHGPFAEGFVQDWSNVFNVALNRASTEMAEKGRALLAHADQQTQLSSFGRA